MDFPSKYLERMERLLGPEFQRFQEALNEKPNVSIRYNPNKTAPNNLPIDVEVPWATEAFYLSQRPPFVFDANFHCGSYYVQEASSMMVDYALRKCLDLSQPLRILDLCAAPGGKSSLVSSMLNTDSLLVSNELVGSRARVLKENLDRWGQPNVIVANNRSDAYEGINNFFDAIVLDAPCSGEGMFRKHDLSVEQWSQKKIDELAAIQRQLLNTIAPLVREDGIIFYSTCTYALEEDEDNMLWFLNEHPEFEQVRFDLNDQWGISNQIAKEYCPHLDQAYRMLFHKARGEGFFFTVFRKTSASGKFKKSKKGSTKLKPLDNATKVKFSKFLKNPEDFELREIQDEIYALPKKHLEDILALDSQLRLIKHGVHLGTNKGKKWIPTHEFALSSIISRNAFPVISVNHDDALRFYKGLNLEIDNKPDQGWALIEHNNNILGWVKVLPNRINNHLPKGWEIRKPLEF